MVLRSLIVLLLPLAMSAAGSWTAFRAGPFEVLTAAGQRPGRELLNTLEQLRYTLGVVLGKHDIEPVWPVRVSVFDSPRQARGVQLSTLKLSRDAWVGAVVKNGPLPIRECVRLLLEASTGRMPAEVESGLLDVFSTIQVQAIRITLGTPPPSGRRTMAWARVHLLTITPEYSGRAPVFFSNLAHGADWEAACHNAFEKTPAELDAEVQRYLAAGSFPARKISGAPINPRRDFVPRQVPPERARLALADLLDGEAARAAYQAILNEFGKVPGALEGLGDYAGAIDAGSKSARCWLEFGRRQREPAKARAAYSTAAARNPRWAEPYFRMAELDSDPALKARHLRKATELEPRNTAYWQALAEACLKAHDFAGAGRAWSGALRSAASQAERERFRQARQAVERQRADYLAGERRRRAEQRERELQRLKQEAMDRIRAAEQQANAATPEAPKGRVVVPWWDDTRPKSKVQGLLTRVVCSGATARLLIQDIGGNTVRILVRDPSKVVVLGGGERTLACGPLKPPRRVTVEYLIRPDARLGTAGEASVIEFQ